MEEKFRERDGKRKFLRDGKGGRNENLQKNRDDGCEIWREREK